MERGQNNQDAAPTQAADDADRVRTTDDLVTSGRVVTPAEGRARRRRRRQPPQQAEGPPEDEEAVPVGSWETWDQSGQGLDAVGSGMTGDEQTVGLTGTGFEDDTEL